MAVSIKDVLASHGVLQHVILPSQIDLILAGLEVADGPNPLADGIFGGTAQLKTDLSKSPLPGFDFALAAPPGPKPAPFKLKLDPPGAPTAFQFWLVLADQEQALFIFKFVKGVPGLLLTGATKTTQPDGTIVLEALAAGDPNHDPVLVSRSPEAGAALGPALLISGLPAAQAEMHFTPDTDSTKGIVSLGLQPPMVVFGSSQIGFECSSVVIDDSDVDKAPGDGAPALDPPLATIVADTPSWRGIVARDFEFYLPASVPLFGGRAIQAFFAISSGSGGSELVIESAVPARAEAPSRPGYSIRIECMDPTANGLSALLPTLISATMELPLDGNQQHFADDGGSGRDLTFAAGKPVRLTATFARDPVNDPSTLKLTLGVAAQGEDGIISVTSSSIGGAKIFNTAAALATALIADKDIAKGQSVGDTPGVVLAALLAAGTVLSSLFTDESHFVLHGVEIESAGHGFPVGGPIVVTLDYSVALRVDQIDIGVLSVSMNPDQPMRIRVRKARMSLDPGKSGLDMIGLDFGRADMEVEDPGAWNVGGLQQLFDVLRSRSGRGSSWMEVDLRFKINLGPVQVSGATIRATLNNDGTIGASIRGLEASLTIPGAIEATGGVQMIKGGFAANLSATVIPLNLVADAGIVYAPPMILLRLSVDLPAPLPLANTGFGLLGVGGLLGFSAVPDYGPDGDPDPVLKQLKWSPDAPDAFKEQRGESTFGLSAAVGTLPDFGFSFSAKAGVLISVPDIAVRGSLNGKVLQPAITMASPSFPPGAGISFLGFIAVDASALTFGLLGEVNLLPLLEVRIPLGGNFPFKGDTSDWYVYLGADGAPQQGRAMGPISARVLPDILNSGADAYLMMRGHGILGWPFGRSLPCGPIDLTDGFVLAFGFSLQNTYGVEPIVWAEIYASLDLLIGATPPTLAGFGTAGGSLNLGPFSLGVQAQVAFLLSRGVQYFWAEVSGTIKLFFFEIEGKITISFGNKPDVTLPVPDLHPLDHRDGNGNRAGSVGVLTDDTYRTVAALVEDPTLIDDTMRVWPDAMVSLPFVIRPSINLSAATQFPQVAGPGALPPPGKVGSEMLHYAWRLDGLSLVDVTDEADKAAGMGTPPVGQLSCRWQAPRGDGTATDFSELVLFSTSPTLWINRLADGGAGMATNPLQTVANLCQTSVTAQGGWAIGFLAGQGRGEWRLPPDPVSTNPMVSRVEATLQHFGLTTQRQSLPLGGVQNLPAPFSRETAQLVAWPSSLAIKRTFVGHVIAPNLRWLPGLPIAQLLQIQAVFAGQQARLTLTEAVVNGLLILVAARNLFDIREDFIGLRVFDDTGAEWTHTSFLTIPTGEAAAIFQPQADHTVRQLLINYPVGQHVGIVGVGGLTLSARDLAAAANKSIADEAARQAAAAAAGPSLDPTVNSPGKRIILAPGRTYRIDVDMVWAGEISKQDDTGKSVAAQTVNFDDPDLPDLSPHSYAPKGEAAIRSTRRQLFFKTTPAPVDRNPVQQGNPAFARWLHVQQDVFQPEMLQRYLAGYEPGQSEAFRFFADPLRAHFSQDHVVALAKAYGFDLLVSVQRVDAPASAGGVAVQLVPVWSAATDQSVLSKTDQLRYGLAVLSPCSVPKPGATATIPDASLHPETWYDIHVVAQPLNLDFSPGHLPGVTFKTSRWPAPTEMLLDLGFTIAGLPAPAPAPTGDLEIIAPLTLSPAIFEDDDQAFGSAMTLLGLEGWPTPAAPRLSRLWVTGADGSSLFAGLLIESQEPIHRPSRLDITGLSLQMGFTGANVHFDLRRRDRSGSRLLYLTSTPFHVVTRERSFGHAPLPGPILFHQVTPTLVLETQSTLSSGVTPLNGSLLIPVAPGYSEDPS